MEDDDGIHAAVAMRSGGVKWVVEAAVVVVASTVPDGAEILLVIRLPLPLPLPLRPAVALPGVGVASVLATTDEYSEASSLSRAVTRTAAGGAPPGADGTAASAEAVLDDGKGDAANPSSTPMTSLPPDTGAAATPDAAAAAAAALDAEKSAMLPIMYSDTTRGSTEDSGSRMTPSRAECAKELSAELAPEWPPGATAAASEGGTPPRVGPPEGCRQSVVAGASQQAKQSKATQHKKGGQLYGRFGSDFRRTSARLRKCGSHHPQTMFGILDADLEGQGRNLSIASLHRLPLSPVREILAGDIFVFRHPEHQERYKRLLQ